LFVCLVGWLDCLHCEEAELKNVLTKTTQHINHDQLRQNNTQQRQNNTQQRQNNTRTMVNKDKTISS
jgi:hypothetical protein